MKRWGIIVCCVILFCALGSVPGYALEALQPLTIRLNWRTNVEFAGILLAQEYGWYQEAGIDLTVKGWEAGVSVIDEVVSGAAQIGVIDGSQIIKEKAAGQPIVAFAAQYQKFGLCLFSKKESGISSPADMKGKKVGIKNAEHELMVRVMLAHQGLQFEDITPVSVGWNLDPLLDGRVDVLGGLMNNEPLVLNAQGIEVNVMPAFQYGYDFYGAVMLTTETLLQEQPDLLRTFWDITRRGWQEAFQDYQKTAQVIVENYYPDGTVEHQAASLKVFHTLATLGINEKLIGFMEEEFWAKGIDVLLAYEQIDEKIPAQRIFTLDILKELYM